MIAQRKHYATHALLILGVSAVLSGCASAPQPAASGRSEPEPRVSAVQTVGDQAAEIALAQVGVPYRYGGQTPSGFDCSGLVHYAYHRAGKAVPRTTGQLWSGTTPVSRSEMQAGDVLFFSIEGKMSHVGLYLGGGRFVHAPSSGKTVNVATLTSDFYRKAFIRAGRP